MRTMGFLHASLAAIASGALLFASDDPLGLWWLQFVAFVPLLWSLRARPTKGWLLGLLFALGYGSPLLICAGQSPPVLIAGALLLVQWTILGTFVQRALRGQGAILSTASTAAIVTVFELFIWHVVPVFGAGQCFSRPLANAPTLVAFAAYGGLASVVFALVFAQGLLVASLQQRRGSASRPRRASLALLLLVGGLGAASTTASIGIADGRLMRVAVAGWNDKRPPLTNALVLASDDGAQLLVTPETGTTISDVESGAALWGPKVQAHNLAVVLGAWNEGAGDNRSLMFDATGQLVGDYRKTHLVPVFEQYPPGDGAPVLATLDGVRVGTMICQDDNFTDVARALGQEGTQLLTVPTNDWPAVAPYHLTNSMFRSIETGCAMARATSGGTSALVSAGGHVVGTMDHVDSGYGVLVGDIVLGSGHPTLHTRLGDWPMFIVCIALMILALVTRGRHQPTPSPTA